MLGFGAWRSMRFCTSQDVEFDPSSLRSGHLFEAETFGWARPTEIISNPNNLDKYGVAPVYPNYPQLEPLIS